MAAGFGYLAAVVICSVGRGSEVMLAIGVGDGVGGRAAECAILLKNDAVGRKISSVFDFLSPFPVCISRPSSLQVSFKISQPAIMSSLVLKGKLPSSRYRMCVTAVAHDEVRLFVMFVEPPAPAKAWFGITVPDERGTNNSGPRSPTM